MPFVWKDAPTGASGPSSKVQYSQGKFSQVNMDPLDKHITFMAAVSSPHCAELFFGGIAISAVPNEAAHNVALIQKQRPSVASRHRIKQGRSLSK